MPLDAAALTLAKLNSVLGGKGGEWGSEAPPTGAALDSSTRARARELGNEGLTVAAVDLLLSGAQQVKFAVPPSLLDEIEQTVLPQANDAQLATIGGALAVLRGVRSGADMTTSQGGLFAKLFGRK
jgi:hypothetical protein